MKKIQLRYRLSPLAIYTRVAIGLTLIVLATHGFSRLFAESKQNVLSSQISSVLLKHWSITADPSPNDFLKSPPDSAWQPFASSPENEKFAFGNWLLRTEVIFADSAGAGSPIGLFPTRLAAAYEIYWDGVRIARNGVPGVDRLREQAGLFSFNLLLPAHLAVPGKHTILLRISNHQGFSSWRWYYGQMFVGRYEAELNSAARSSSLAFLTIGVLSIPFLFNLFLYFARSGRVEHLLFSLICCLVIVDTLAGQLPLLADVSTLYSHWELTTYQIISALLGILFPLFFVYLFSLPRRMIVFIVVVNVVVLLFFNEFKSMFGAMSLVVLVLSSAMTVWAAIMRREGSVITLIGLIPAWIAYAFYFAFAGLAAILVICTSLTTARQIAGKERAEREAQLKSARLENELLRKNINPHFLLNTLTSIIVWLRKDTKSAIKLIEALAEEFRLIAQISALQRIPVGQEIDLCRAHLRIMSYRKGAEYRLEASGIVEEEEIPPMIFHTLIENGLTHGYESKTRGVFTLERIKRPDSVQYRLSNDGDFTENGKNDSSGFGLKYIKSRLEESYPGRWNIISQKCPQGWETIIELRNK